MRKYLMAGNWKMNKTIPEAIALSQQLCNYYNREWDKVDVVLCVPAIDIKSVHTVLDFDKTDIELGAQNVHQEPSGAYTGEISIPMIKDAGCTYCIVGHSERREYFGETDEDVNLKVKELVLNKVNAIVCVGESLNVRDSERHIEFVTAQVRAALAGLDVEDLDKVVVAYEPIWAIGTGRTATPEQAEEVCAAIRATIAGSFTQEAADSVRVLYGGSMNQGNVDSLLAMQDIDGGLVGGASLDANSFKQLIEAAAKAS
ncbi:triose-phosphate isomerase [Anaerotardibacter muris]|uniref:triose-phosphate isomerase n=1 Tax=Anaerotardibacter muris TaxID=2941505 RepID=UPI002040FB7C|nr:triose-phosphate isomerase [Anaerotardibacter muris]